MHAWGLRLRRAAACSRWRTPPLVLPVGPTPSAPWITDFGAQYPACIYPCPTLRVRPHDRPRMARGQSGSLFLSLYDSFIHYSTPVYPDAIRTSWSAPLGAFDPAPHSDMLGILPRSEDNKHATRRNSTPALILRCGSSGRARRPRRRFRGGPRAASRPLEAVAPEAGNLLQILPEQPRIRTRGRLRVRATLCRRRASRRREWRPTRAGEKRHSEDQADGRRAGRYRQSPRSEPGRAGSIPDPVHANPGTGGPPGGARRGHHNRGYTRTTAGKAGCRNRARLRREIFPVVPEAPRPNPVGTLGQPGKYRLGPGSVFRPLQSLPRLSACGPATGSIASGVADDRSGGMRERVRRQDLQRSPQGHGDSVC